jgi:DNA-directed RNA polymerase subunit RPC12/RpoP
MRRKPRKHKFGPKKYAMALRWRLTLKCLDCGKGVSANISDLFTQGNVLCPYCNKMQLTKLSTIPAYIRQLAKVGWGRTCANCSRNLRDHAGLKCLFESTTFDGTPRQAEPVASSTWSLGTWASRR